MKLKFYINYRFALLAILLAMGYTSAQAQWNKPQNSNLGKVNTLVPKGQLLYAGTDTGGVYVSSDMGLNWTEKNNGLATKKVRALVVKDSVIIAGVESFGGAIFISKNGGASWTAPTSQYNGFLFCLAEQGNAILGGSWYGVIKSTDNGDKWTTLPVTGLPSNASVTALLANGTTIFAGVGYSSVTTTGLFRSTDNGSNWTDKSSGITNNSFTAIVQKGTTLFVSTRGGGVFVSTNNGDSWTAANNGLTNLMVNTLFANGNALLAGTTGGIFVSTDGAASWTAVSTGLSATNNIWSIATQGPHIFAGTDTSAWRRLTAEVIASKPEIDRGNLLLNVYPNPCNGNFAVELPKGTADAEILVSNTIGQTVYNCTVPQGTLIVPIDMCSAAIGIYTLQVKTNGEITTQKLIVQ